MEKQKKKIYVFQTKSVEDKSISQDLMDMVKITGDYDADSKQKEYVETLQNLGYDPIILDLSFENYKEILQKTLPPPDTPDLIISQECDGSEYDGQIGRSAALYLEEHGYKFLGSSYQFNSYTSDKILMKKRFQECNIPTSPFVEITQWDEITKQNVEKLNFPLIIKLKYGYASMGLFKESVVKDIKECENWVKHMFQVFQNQPLFAEEFIPGTEYTVLVISNMDGSVTSFSTYKTMIDYSQPVLEQFITFDEKYINWEKLYIQYDPAKQFFDKTDPQLDQAIRTIAEKACIALGMSGYARVDIRKNINNNQILVLEVNDYADTSKVSTIRKILTYNGWTFLEFTGHYFGQEKKKTI